MTAENGGHYLYALDNMRMHASPVLQPGLEAMVNLNDVKSPRPNIARMLARVGFFRSFTLAGVEAITDRPFTGSHYAVWARHPSLKRGRRRAHICRHGGVDVTLELSGMYGPLPPARES